MNKKRISSLLIILMFCVFTKTLPQTRPVVSLSYNRFYSYEEITQILKDLEKKYPRFLHLQSIGKSSLNRDIWLMTVNNPETGDEMTKAAMYIDGNIHGNEVQGSEVVIYTIDYLMTNYGRIDKVTDLVDKRVFYMIPMVNPDGRAHWFDKKKYSGSARSGMKPTDNDNDGLFDEDGCDDLDGDGQILLMRKKVKYGRYRISKEDPRIMEEVPPGEVGDYEILGREGIDNDGDGLINEDGAGGYDMNRNWPEDWQPPYVQYGSGNYPLSYPETRSIANFILDHPNIAGVQSYHNSGGMILRGHGSKEQGPYPWSDQMVYDYIGKKGEEILPFYRYIVIWKDLYPVHGGFVNWTAEGLGIFSFTNELWSSRQYYNRKPEQQNEDGMFSRGRRSEVDRLKFDDLLEMGARFIEWKPFHHPVYGDIEIGGWVRETGRVPPPFMLEELCHRNALFTLFHAEQMPLVNIDTVEVSKIGSNSYRVLVTVANRRVIPTISTLASNKRVVRPDIVSVEGKNIKVVSAGIVFDKWLSDVSIIKNRPERVLLKDGIAGNSTRTIQFIISGSGRARVRLDCIKGGRDEKTIYLK